MNSNQDSLQCQWARDKSSHVPMSSLHPVRLVPGGSGYIQMCHKHANQWNELLKRWTFQYKPNYTALLLKLLNTDEIDYPIA